MNANRVLAASVVAAVLGRADAIRRGFSEILEPSGITLQQYNVLRILRGADPDGLPTLSVGDRMMEQTPGITRLIDRLEKKRLVRRERSNEDRRLVRCTITKRGLTLLRSLDDAMNEADEGVVAGLNRTEKRTLVSLLSRLG